VKIPQERFFSYFDVELFSEQLTGSQIVNDLMNVQLLAQTLRGDRPKAVFTCASIDSRNVDGPHTR